MDEQQIKIDIAVIKEKVQNMTDQMNRFISHLESEQRVTGEISKRVSHCEKQIEIMQTSKVESKWRVETVIGIISLLSSIAAVVVVVLKG